MEVREERVGDDADISAVREVHLRAFGDEGEGEAEKVAALTAALRDRFVPGRGLSLVAEESGRIVGHVMFSPAWLDAPRRLVEVQVLGPLGVLPDHQGRGVGAALVRRGLEILAARSVPVVFLEGHPTYYPRLGFAPGGGLGFRKPSLRITDAGFQAIRLPAYEPWMTGTLVYPDVFWEFDSVGLRPEGGA